MTDEQPRHNHDFPAVTGTPPGECPACDHYGNWPAQDEVEPQPLTPDGSVEHVLAARIADAVIIDLMQRHGFEQEWDQVDRSTRQEIRSDWIDLARAILEEDPGPDNGAVDPTVEIVRAARGLVRTAHPTDVGKHEVVRQWWDSLVAAVEALPDRCEHCATRTTVDPPVTIGTRCRGVAGHDGDHAYA